MRKIVVDYMPGCFGPCVDVIAGRQAWVAIDGTHADIKIIRFTGERNHDVGSAFSTKYSLVIR